MCIIIVQKAGNEVTEEHFRESWRVNKDGGGMMYAVNGEIHVYKQMKSVDAFYKAYKSVVTTHPDINIVLHFRIASHGTVNKANCHPFQIHDGLWFCHNGIIDIKLPDKAKHSDTREFMYSILKELPKSFLKFRVYRRLISKFIGHSKLAFLDKDGKVTLIKSSLGHWDKEGGIWYSNNSYKVYQPVGRSGFNYQDDYYGRGYNKNWVDSYYGHKGWNKKKAQGNKVKSKNKASGLMSNPAGSNKKSTKESDRQKEIKNRTSIYNEGYGKKIKNEWKGQEGYDWAEDGDSTEQKVPVCSYCNEVLSYPCEVGVELCLSCQEECSMAVVTSENSDEKTVQAYDGSLITISKRA